MKNLETEFKWDATLPYAFRKMLMAVRKATKPECISTPVYLTIKDLYLDTPNKELQKQKIALRIRNTNGIYEATYKTRSEVKNGKAVRREETLPLPGIHTFRVAMKLLSNMKTWQGIPLEGLRPLFEIRNKRIVRAIQVPGACLELSFDTCMIAAGDKKTKFKEIELELKNGNEKAMEVFVQEISLGSGLSFSTKSKVKTASLLLEGK